MIADLKRDKEILLKQANEQGQRCEKHCLEAGKIQDENILLRKEIASVSLIY